MAGWGPVLLRLAKLAETAAAIRLLTGWGTPREFGSAALKVAVIRAAAIALESLVVGWANTGGIAPWSDQDWGQVWGLASPDLDTDTLALVLGSIVILGLVGSLSVLGWVVVDIVLCPAIERYRTWRIAEAPAIPAPAAPAIPAPAPDQSAGIFECVVDRLELRSEASEASRVEHTHMGGGGSSSMVTPDLVRQGEHVLICGAVTLASSGQVYLRRLDGGGFYPSVDARGRPCLRRRGPLPRPVLETDWVSRPTAATVVLPRLPTGTMMLGERAVRLRQWVETADQMLQAARADVEQRCIAVHAEHQQVIDTHHAAQQAEIDRVVLTFRALVKREEDSRDEAIAVVQHARRAFIDESTRMVARVAQEAAEAERAGTFMGWLSPAKLSYGVAGRSAAGAPGVAAAPAGPGLGGPVAGIPDEFKCSISREVMEEPVITGCGHTFERQQLERWLSKNTNCPECRGAVRTPLTPNHNLRHAIRKWKRVGAA